MKGGFVYILTNRKDGVLYLGVTNDLANRVEQHRTGTVSSFTKKYQCHRLVWFEPFENIHDARETEKRMKAWKRAWKIRLIEEANPGWNDLADTLV
ncbi:GIY-YIG nuclease family protein [Erythrobacter litoralis]|uniref:Excinuclease ABC, C subunit, N-terminal n=1 Tax=Erythrobacter litoralis (strain HTCC2594) TaxID=314225 RepID=Q2N9F0_ERYLH|nr:GIY-YIG nuclease family protein [Erythrobacter litoralis]ABC63691.1 Excinuclease ABC, C subunit, N-terminal [Erythrobacter litoralis HTCC2594]